MGIEAVAGQPIDRRFPEMEGHKEFSPGHLLTGTQMGFQHALGGAEPNFHSIAESQRGEIGWMNECI